MELQPQTGTTLPIKNTRLSEIIIQKIKEHGLVSFRDFMEMCLYYPELGYYTSSKEKIGTKGDFYTSSNLTPAFGASIGRQLEEMWTILGENEFTIVEYGAGTGSLCHDILDYCKSNRRFYDQLNYYIIEKSHTMRAKEKQYLHEKVSWYNSMAEIGEITGCVLSNELVDNFAVHQVVMQDELMEVFVDYENNFFEVLKPAGKELKNYLSELNIQLPKDFRTEINLEAIEWIKNIASFLNKGYVITIDYGYQSSELYSKQRSCGTLLCYNKHNINDQVFNNLGEQDITSHVNFSALCHWGAINGLESCGLTSQAQFLLSLGFREHLLKTTDVTQNIAQAARKASLHMHTMLIDMGSKYKVLIQRKGISDCDLLGLKLS